MNSWTTCLSLSAMLFFAPPDADAQYFQQDADYIISVTLDTRQHILRGHWSLDYRNNSPDTLRELFLHLYPNAYSSKTSAFARQQQRLGLHEFQFADFGQMGGIDSLDFNVNNSPAPWSLDKENPDIASVTLTQPLLPGKSITISSPMRVRIPHAFSRMGRIDESYQLTQWYPRPAVYDLNGWNLQPYLDQGEFFGEFGSFDVSITLPGQHIIAATGELITEDLARMLDSLAAARNAPLSSFPAAKPQRTWRYKAENVHDFAWFSDPRFGVRSQSIEIDGKSVTCNAFFTTTERRLWESATGYLADAITFYSSRIGPYPYPQMTAVQIPLGNGFGMEYPMITAINLAGTAKDLDDVLAHEVGHNWFQGAIGSNERKHPWMDEGINTYYEHAYLRQKYETWSENLLPYRAVHPHGMSDEQRMLQFMTREHKLVAPDTDPEYASELQNFFGSYFKPAIAFDMLREYMGHAQFDDAMRSYYAQWRFRHPRPEDFEAVLAQKCNCDLSWLFIGLIKTPALIDYRLQSYEDNTITIENQGKINAPVHLIAIRDSAEVYGTWVEGFTGTKSFVLNLPEADYLQIYREIYTLDLTPGDNILRIENNTNQRKRLRFRLFGGKAYPGESYLNILPAAGWNYADHGMAGIALSNTYWPPGKLQWAVVPLYSVNAKTLVGAGEVRYRTSADNSNKNFEFGLGIKSFHFLQDTHYGYFNRYLKIAPRIRYAFGQPQNAQTSTQHVQYRFIHVRQGFGQGVNFSERIWEKRSRTYAVHELQYTRIRDRGPGGFTFTGTLHAGQGFVRASADFNQHFVFTRSGSSILLHGFAGYLPVNDDPAANVNFMFNGIQSTGISSRDYLYDELLFSRNAESGQASQLVFNKDAQLKTLYTGGISDRWMIAAGVAVELPVPVPLRPYVDAAIFHDPFTGNAEFSYSGGIAVVLRKDVFEIYLPMVESSDIRNSLTYVDKDTFFKRVSLMVDLSRLHPFDFTGLFY